MKEVKPSMARLINELPGDNKPNFHLVLPAVRGGWSKVISFLR